jgi:hypothetical protein
MGSESSNTSDGTDEGVIRILFPYETVCPKVEVSAYLSAMLKCPLVEVYFKARPDMDPEEQLREYCLSNEEQKQVHVIMRLYDLTAPIDVVCGTYSTFLYEQVMQGIRVGYLETSSDYGMGLVENDLADRLEKGDLCDTLRRLMRKGDDELISRRKRLCKGGPLTFDQHISEELKV